MAEKWFGFIQSDRVKVHISDGVKFLEDVADKKSKYMLDVVHALSYTLIYNC